MPVLSRPARPRSVRRGGTVFASKTRAEPAPGRQHRRKKTQAPALHEIYMGWRHAELPPPLAGEGWGGGNPLDRRTQPIPNSRQFLMYFISRLGPTSAPKMLPMASAATPSAALDPVAFSAGSGMKAATEPSIALPTRMPRFQPS